MAKFPMVVNTQPRRIIYQKRSQPYPMFTPRFWFTVALFIDWPLLSEVKQTFILSPMLSGVIIRAFIIKAIAKNLIFDANLYHKPNYCNAQLQVTV